MVKIVKYTHEGQTLRYRINEEEKFAVVINPEDKISGDVVIPAEITYNGTTYPVTNIGNLFEKAFSGCSDLTSIVIPNSVTCIEGCSFENCSSLASITIPNSVTEIGRNAFSGCSGLENIIVESGNSIFDSRDNCNAIIESSTNKLKLGCKNTIIPNSVTSIGNEAFSGCSSLTNITIPNSVTSIGRSTFENCSSLTNITIPNSVTSIGDYAFKDCSSLTSITIPDLATSIGFEAFCGCSSLTNITIPNSVTSIGDKAFSGCSSLTSIVVEAGNPEYDSRDNCNAIIETSKNKLIAGCENTIIPNSIVEIDHKAFYGCTGLTSITIPNSVTKIGLGVFVDCSGLISIVVEAGNPEYDSRDNCNAIIKRSSYRDSLIVGCKNTIIPNSVTSIGEEAFSGCSSLTNITIPNSVTKISSEVFEGCRSLTNITIPNSVTEIGCSTFENCSSLTSIEIPDSVTEISWNTFKGCSSLTSITIPNSVTKIERDAFLGCSSLTSIEIPNSVTEIESNAFEGCKKLESVTIGTKVKKIDHTAFRNCESLHAIYSMKSKPPSIVFTSAVFEFLIKPSDYIVFEGVPSEVKLFVPKGKVDIYGTAVGWEDFTNIEEMVSTKKAKKK